MMLESVTVPMENLRDRAMRLGTQWATTGRHFGGVALRSSAGALRRTADRVDAVAQRLTPVVSVPVESPVVAQPLVADVSEVTATSIPLAGTREPEAMAVETPVARSSSKKKHRTNRRG
jgi:hypothetical protein